MQGAKTGAQEILQVICKFAGELVGAIVVTGKKIARSLKSAGTGSSSKPDKKPAQATATSRKRTTRRQGAADQRGEGKAPTAKRKKPSTRARGPGKRRRLRRKQAPSEKDAQRHAAKGQ